MLELNRIYQGDCLKLLQEIPDESIDIVITDPPYSSGGMFRSDRAKTTTEKYVVTGTEIKRPEFQGDNKDQRAFGFWSMYWLSECYRVLKTGSVICVFSDWRQLPIMTDVFQGGGFVWRGVFVWNKTEAARPDRGRFRAQCEYVIWGTKGPMVENTDICLPGAFTKAVNSTEKLHTTGKPLELIKLLLQIAPEKGVVLDPFAGSGTTCAAAKATNRPYIGMEISNEYADIARARLERINNATISNFGEVSA